MTRPPMSLSHSSMLALICAFNFVERYVRSTRPEPSSIQAQIGTHCHTIIADYIAHCARENCRSDRDKLVEIMTALTETLPPRIAEQVEAVIGRFARFKINRKARAHYCERLLAVDRNWNPIEVEWDAANHRVVNPPVDCITGQLDYIADYGRRAEIIDWKSGQEFVEPGDAKHNPQLVLYAALWLASNPECKYVDTGIWGIRYGEDNRDSYRFRREYVLELARNRAEYYFAKLDALWPIIELGGNVPAQADSLTTCGYCTAAARCPISLALDSEQTGPIQIPRRKPLKTLLKEAS